jgi:hypothetical protein
MAALRLNILSDCVHGIEPDSVSGIAGVLQKLLEYGGFGHLLAGLPDFVPCKDQPAALLCAGKNCFFHFFKAHPIRLRRGYLCQVAEGGVVGRFVPDCAHDQGIRHADAARSVKARKRRRETPGAWLLVSLIFRFRY